ncbi:uncharacterized protein LOC143177135 isoform X2 [Calliopsis andreniformis]|uniref:uncharacterized protein LOC143177135 isoform X2 n=1 Tax=Calliopsis andreniformis TaxID=337506 RepID=UPI003FCCC923
MPIAGGILVAGTAAHCLSSAAGMLRFLARLSGRRRHVRRSSGPGGGARAVEGTEVAAGVGGPGERGDEGRGAGGCEAVGASLIEELLVSSPVADGEVCCSDSSTTNYHHRPHHLRLGHRRHGRHSSEEHQQEQCQSERSERCRRDCVGPSDELVVDGEADDEASCQAQPVHAPHRDIHQLPHLHHHPHHLHRLHQRLQEHRDRDDGEDRLVPTSDCHSDGTTIDDHPATVTAMTRGCRIPPYLATLLILSYTLFGIADACSSRSTPKPRPPTPTPRPNITFHMYTCPPDYAEWYCLNGATCFTVKIVDSLLYNCLCANGYIGQRCEFKDLDGSYLPSRQRVMLETASIAGGATIAVFLVVIICIAAYIHCKRKQKELRSSNCVDTVDGPGRDLELRPFSNRSRSLMIFMTKNPNSSTPIEQTRMPGWSCPETESMRMASISEGKRSNQ